MKKNNNQIQVIVCMLLSSSALFSCSSKIKGNIEDPKEHLLSYEAAMSSNIKSSLSGRINDPFEIHCFDTVIVDVPDNRPIPKWEGLYYQVYYSLDSLGRTIRYLYDNLTESFRISNDSLFIYVSSDQFDDTLRLNKRNGNFGKSINGHDDYKNINDSIVINSDGTYFLRSNINRFNK